MTDMLEFKDEHEALVNEITEKIMSTVVRPHVSWDSQTDNEALESIRHGMRRVLNEIYSEALDVNNNVNKPLGL